MCVSLLAKIPNDDYNALVRLSRSTGVPITEVAGIMICHLFDYRDREVLEELVHDDLTMYRNQLTIRSAILAPAGDLLPASEEITVNEPTATEDLAASGPLLPD